MEMTKFSIKQDDYRMFHTADIKIILLSENLILFVYVEDLLAKDASPDVKCMT